MSSDYGHRLTDIALSRLEKQIKEIYGQARDELDKTVKAYFADFERRDKAMKAQLDAGKIEQDYYTQWRLNQIGRGRRFEALRDEMAERYTRANEVAVSYINDKTPGIYSLNHNYMAYTIEKAAGDVGFTLFDEQTVRRLAVEQPDLMPNYPKSRALKRGIDLEYGKKQITSCVTSSILQGKGVREIADDLQTRIPEMERVSAVRTARTAVTGAENAGRLDGLLKARERGIDVGKEWVATMDGRTRHSHRAVDGEVADLEAAFSNGLRYPGDPSGPGREVYNCRCTLAGAYDKSVEAEPHMRRVKNPETGKYELNEDMSYREWEKRKRNTRKVESSRENDIIKQAQVGTANGMKSTKPSNESAILSKEQVVEKAKTFSESQDYSSVHSMQALRAVTSSKLGYDGYPKVLNADEFESAAQGKTRFYRGIRPSPDKTSEEIAEEFKHGHLWTGNTGGAAYGTGVYFTATESIAKGDYAGDNGTVIEMILDNSAKIADYRTILQEFIETGIPKIFGTERENYQLILADVGQYVAMKGYDAIALNGFQGHDYVILLNRAKAIVKE